jgi:hypothetical protein
MDGPSQPRPSGPAGRTREAHLEQLRVEAAYHRDRYDLYRAKVYGPRPTTLERLRELERTCAQAEARLAHALTEASPESE